MPAQFRRTVLGVATALLVGTAGAAQVSPYSGLARREIKALSTEEIAALLAGEGMGFALAAELNGLPGPKHVLELADSLNLSAAQRSAAQSTYDAMLLEARRLGAAIVAAERDLDSALARGTLERAALATMTAHVAELRGRLRFTHLAAHLEIGGLLTGDQMERYARLRGYGSDGGGHADHDRSHRQPDSPSR